MVNPSWMELEESSTLVLGCIERLGELLQDKNDSEAQEVYAVLLDLVDDCRKVCGSILERVLMSKTFDKSSDEYAIGIHIASFVFDIKHSLMVMSGNEKPDEAFYQWRNNLDEMVMLSGKLAKRLIESN